LLFYDFFANMPNATPTREGSSQRCPQDCYLSDGRSGYPEALYWEGQLDIENEKPEATGSHQS
jgi:hypothetical protein